MHEVPRRCACREVHGETATELFLCGFQAVFNSSCVRCLAATLPRGPFLIALGHASLPTLHLNFPALLDLSPPV